MKKYKVKFEYIDQWGNDSEWCDNPIVTEAEVRQLADGWCVSVDELMAQVEEIESDEDDPA